MTQVLMCPENGINEYAVQNSQKHEQCSLRSRSQCGGQGVWIVVITSGPFIYVARTLVECSWKFAEILPRMKNLEARFEVQISLV